MDDEEIIPPEPPKKQDPIARALGTPALIPIKKKDLTAFKKEAATDYDLARGNLENVLDVGTEALAELTDIAQLSQDPRVYRVMNETMATMIALSKTLMDIKKDALEIEKVSQDVEEGPQPTIHNNLNITTNKPMSLDDVLDAIDKRKGSKSE